MAKLWDQDKREFCLSRIGKSYFIINDAQHRQELGHRRSMIVLIHSRLNHQVRLRNSCHRLPVTIPEILLRAIAQAIYVYAMSCFGLSNENCWLNTLVLRKFNTFIILSSTHTHTHTKATTHQITSDRIDKMLCM